MSLNSTTLQLPQIASAWGQHVIGGHAQGGKACLYTHSEGAKALFSYIHLQVTDCVWGTKPGKFFHWGQCPVAPAGTCLLWVDINQLSSFNGNQLGYFASIVADDTI